MFLKFYFLTKRWAPILEATDEKAVGLIVRIAVDRGVVYVQVPFPGIGPRHGRRPAVLVVAQIVERAIGVAVAGQKT